MNRDSVAPFPGYAGSSGSSGRSDPVHPLNGEWKRYVLIAVLALIVMAAGAAIGAGVTILYFGRMFIQQPGAPDQTARLIAGRLSQDANLSPEERAKTEALVEQQMAEVAAIREKYEKEVTRKLGAMSDGITDIIGDERANMCGEWMRRYRGMGGPGRGGAEGAKKKMECRCTTRDAQ
jgi:hypothetical protein